ncbi:hypothetical protein DFA_05033 [Cavenderia fasciculata]|uniref:G-protein-coupled receptor family protein n=1 Tax=Cavenderia fasciculata TaxID=261658 RepID=F4PN10_CACFS|nr:uncharacterized protein DFA_05033 [Cavenderia fasciculata]EGG22903.1 hypothetical protein DFA_05033 [Cavenderia fasciculata]|eukprot:XP_004360754.1 hypothetical protein DFA_05033 [Cavenderia fasciculata]
MDFPRFNVVVLFAWLPLNSAATNSIYYPIDNGAKCEPYIGDRTDFNFNLCQGLLTTPDSIYVGSSTNQVEMRSKVEGYFGLIMLLGSKECKDNPNTFKNLCSFVFRECVKIELNSKTNSTSTNTVIVPRRTCQENCKESTKLCAIDKSMFDCEMADPIYTNLSTPLPFLPPSGSPSLFNLTDIGGQSNFSVQCLDTSASNLAKATNQCPYPLVYADYPGHPAGYYKGYFFISNNSDCVLRCPIPVFAERDWHKLFVFYDVVSYFSFFGSVFIFITYVGLSKFKTNNERNLALFLTHITIMSISGILNTWVGRGSVGDFICQSERQTITGDSRFCVFNAFLFQFGAFSASLWFVIMCFEIWYTITHFTRKLELFKYYFVATLFLASLFSFIPLGLQTYGYNQGNFMCMISGSNYAAPLFWIPLGILLSIATIFLFMIMYQIYVIVKATGRSGIFKLEIKPMVLVFSFYCSFVYSVFWNYYSEHVITKKIAEEGIPRFVECLLMGNTDCILGGPTFGMMVAYIFFLRVYGLYGLLIYGFNQKCLTIWRKSIFIRNPIFGYFNSKILAKSTKEAPSREGSAANPSGLVASDSKASKKDTESPSAKTDLESTIKSISYGSDSDSEEQDENSVKLQQRVVSIPPF